MNSDLLLRNWGPLVALALLAIAGVSVAFALLRRRPAGQLRQHARVLHRKRAELASKRQRLARAERRLAKLRERARNIPPRRLREAEEAVEDAKALAAIAHDQVLIAGNHLRRVIIEEFPPSRHDALRTRYLANDD